MWVLMLVPVAIVAALTLMAALRRAPSIEGVDPLKLRTVVDWRDEPLVAADVGDEAAEQLRQLVGALAEQRFIFSASINKSGDKNDLGPVAVVDVREIRLELRARLHRGGRWLLWVNDRGRAPDDTDDLRQLLTGIDQTLEERKAEDVRWYRREGFSSGADPGAPSPFYER